MRSVIKKAANTFNAVSTMLELTAMNGANVMAGLNAHADEFRKRHVGKCQFKAIKREKKWKDKAEKLGIDPPVIKELKL